MRQVFVLGLGLLLLNMVQGGDATTKDTEAIQGSWTIVDMVQSGAKLPPPPLDVVFKGGRMQLRVDGKIDNEADFKLDASKQPRTFDVPGIMRGIYALDGNTLKICEYHQAVAKKEERRPTAFSSTKENGYDLLVLKRKKD